MFLRTLAFFLTLVAGSASAQSIRDNFFSDDVILKAVEDISRMRTEELRALRDRFAECRNSFWKNDLVRNSCEVARDRYDIEYGAARPLDKLLYALSFVSDTIRVAPTLKDHSKEVMRVVGIESKLKTAITSQFAILRDKARGGSD